MEDLYDITIMIDMLQSMWALGLITTYDLQHELLILYNDNNLIY
jgi:hypothetical protein